MTVNIFKGRSKKVADFEIEIGSKLDELIERMDCLQLSDARLRQDIRQIIREDTRQIVREEIKSILDSRNKKAWWNIA